jgi:hypothetical protein
MSSMQAFHEWLSSAAEAPEAYRNSLVHLTQASRTQILSLASDLTWFIWSTDKALGTS